MKIKSSLCTIILLWFSAFDLRMLIFNPDRNSELFVYQEQGPRPGWASTHICGVYVCTSFYKL